MDITSRRHLPNVDALAARLEARGVPARVRIRAAQEAVARSRLTLAEGKALTFSELVDLAESLCDRFERASGQPAVNMSGTVLHTGLGRARFDRGSVDAVREAAESHVLLELDWEHGGRGDRLESVRRRLVALTGAEDAFVVNNCAAAVLLALRTHCAGRDVLLSHGQMVEIGGSFRMPDVVLESGCRLVGLGCTNKTRLSDYERAWSDETAAVLRCHPSNFRIVGFTEEPSARDLAAWAHGRGAILIDDVGHGCLVDTTGFGLPKERTLREAVADGADLVLSSGDKLLGGPQAGLVLGTRACVEAMTRHPLARALRVDKLTLAALSHVLETYEEGRAQTLPTWRAAAKGLSTVKREAQALARAYPGPAVVEPGETEMGGGSMPGYGIKTWRVGLHSPSPDVLLTRLRQSRPSVIGRIEKGLVWLDPRTAESDEVKTVCAILKGLTT
ncbi:MAG: L-seryl-tRNA(Sec) selenium transferase [Armatimonadetes bacterium]|nr:L-seryl-tRNA(Sec) selenium transferase [Armatimonadota bacterium]